MSFYLYNEFSVLKNRYNNGMFDDYQVDVVRVKGLEEKHRLDALVKIKISLQKPTLSKACHLKFKYNRENDAMVLAHALV